MPESMGGGSIPQWFDDVTIAKYAGIPLWELEEQPICYYNHYRAHLAITRRVEATQLKATSKK